MIYFSNKKVTAVYIGSMPVSAVYMGEKLIWQDCEHFGTEVSATVVFVSESKILSAGGKTYTAEAVAMPVSKADAISALGSVLEDATLHFPIACAKPHMRHIAPTTDSNISEGVAEALPLAVLTNNKKATATASLTTDVNIRASPAEDSVAEETCGGVHKSDAVAAPAAARRDTYISGITQDNSAVAAPGAAGQGVYASSGIHKSDAIEADGKRDAAACTFEAATHAAHILGISEHAKAIETLQLTPCTDTVAGYAGTQSVETDLYGMTVAARATASSADLSDGQADCAAGPVADVIPSADISKSYGSKSSIFAGGYAAEMSLEMYEEPVQSGNFDSLTIIELDVLPAEDIDNMTILN